MTISIPLCNLKSSGKGMKKKSSSMVLPLSSSLEHNSRSQTLLLPVVEFFRNQEDCHSLFCLVQTVSTVHMLQHARPLSDLAIYFKRHLKNCTKMLCQILRGTELAYGVGNPEVNCISETLLKT